MASPFDVFRTADAVRINRARLEHLAGLGLDLEGKRVLEVGAGIGLHSSFFDDRGCDVTSTDGAPANVVEMQRHFPHRRCAVLDIDRACDLSTFGAFDLVYCYGTLYHLAFPERALAQLAQVCSGQILLETVVSPGDAASLPLVREPPVANQAVGGIGCRPTRSWVMDRLRKCFGHAYTTLEQPDFPDFVDDWRVVEYSGNLRAVFVGSKVELPNPQLTAQLPMRHRRMVQARKPPRVWIDVGAHKGDHSLARAGDEADLIVHAFEPLPALADDLARRAPPNYVVHCAAVSDNDGIADFEVNRFNGASSLLPMDEDVRAGWTGGDVLEVVGRIPVQTVRLDSFMAHNGIQTVEHLKIDAQGADFAVLKSAGERIADIAHVQIEVDCGEVPLYRGAMARDTVVAWLEERGFALIDSELQSHGQEENLTFARIAPIPSDDGVSLDTEPEGEPIAVLDPDTAVVERGTAECRNGTWAVETGPEQWSYALIMPLAVDAALQDVRVRIGLSVEVVQGLAEIGILHRDGSVFCGFEAIAAGPVRTVSLTTPDLGKAGALVVRNAHTAGPTRLELRITTANRCGPPPIIVLPAEFE